MLKILQILAKHLYISLFLLLMAFFFSVVLAGWREPNQLKSFSGVSAATANKTDWCKQFNILGKLL